MIKLKTLTRKDYGNLTVVPTNDPAIFSVKVNINYEVRWFHDIVGDSRNYESALRHALSLFGYRIRRGFSVWDYCLVGAHYKGEAYE